MLDECGCKCVTYANDLLLLVEGESQVKIKQKGTNIVCERGENDLVCVSEGKTVVMLMKVWLQVRDRLCE